MIRIKISDTDYDIKDSFADYTVNEFIEVAKSFNKPISKRLSIYTGVKQSDLDELNLEAFAALCQLVNFVEDSATLSAVCEKYEGKDIGLCTYGSFERAKRIFTGRDILDSIIEVAEFYSCRKLDGKPLLDVWGVIEFYLNSLSNFLNRFKRLSEYENTAEEIAAGVENLEQFGSFATVVKIARQRGMTNDQVLNMTALEVYTEMLLDFETSEYQKNYEQQMKSKNK